MKGIFVTLVVIACPLLWIMIIVPLIAKCFRAPYKIGALPFDRRNHALSRWQSFWFTGVLGWGGTVFLTSVLIRYLGEFKLTVHQLLLGLIIYSIAGGLLSMWNFPHHKTQKANDSSSS